MEAMPTVITASNNSALRELIVMPEPHVAAFAVQKAYRKGEHSVPVLHGVDISVRKGEFLSIIGQ